jgi:hypothetical protein
MLDTDARISFPIFAIPGSGGKSIATALVQRAQQISEGCTDHIPCRAPSFDHKNSVKEYATPVLVA